MFNILLIKNNHYHIFHSISLIFLCDLYFKAIYIMQLLASILEYRSEYRSGLVK